MVYVTLLVVLGIFAGFIYLTTRTLPGKLLSVAQAAYLECVRQPLFWFLLVFALFVMFIGVFIPFFTFKNMDDVKMYKSLTMDTVLMATLILTVFTASHYISEELEGRTAITLLSKPMSRRQFLLGKFLGTLMGALLMASILAIFVGWLVQYRTEIDRAAAVPEEIQALDTQLSFLPQLLTNAIKYLLLIFYQVQLMAPGIVLNGFQITILTAVGVALATRLPMVVNLVVCLSFFFVGRLTHVLEAKSAGNELVQFVARVFATILPGFNYFDVGPAIVADVDVPWGEYVLLSGGVHAALYTSIALLFGLILFEDRDLA